MSQKDLIESKIRNAGPAWHRAAVRTALVAGLFCVVVAVLLADNYLRSQLVRTQLLGTAGKSELAAMKADLLKTLNEDPSNVAFADKLRWQIRSFDLMMRQALIRSTELARVGGRLLLAGVTVFFAALVCAVKFRQKLPAPSSIHGHQGEERRAAKGARWSVGTVSALFIMAAAAAALVPATARAPASVDVGNPAENWPGFRGPGGLGVSARTNAPMRWDGSTGKNILWKTSVPLPGQNSPVVWGGRLFVSGADEKRREVYCFDAATGSLLWRAAVDNVPNSPTDPPTIIEATGYAAPTLATDGRRVCAIFANGDLACFNLEGRRLWAVNLGLPENHYGHASSLLIHNGLLIVQFDQNSPRNDKSALLAFNVADGRLVWKATRAMPASWSSPIVIRAAGRDQLITCGTPWVIAYDPATGGELWRADCLGGEVGPSPTYAAGLVFAANEGSNLAAIKPEGRGDVTSTHIAWTSTQNLPNTSSILSNGELVFTVTGGTLTCYDARDGTVAWVHHYDEFFNSSPTLAGNRIYLMDVTGVMHVVRAAPDGFEELTTAPLGEESSTSPAFLDGRIYIRGAKHLFCIGGPDGGR